MPLRDAAARCDRKIDWFRLEDDDYGSLAIDEQGIIRSQVFPGLWLASSVLLNGEMQQVLAVLQQGITSEEHPQLVQQLAQARQSWVEELKME